MAAPGSFEIAGRLSMDTREGVQSLNAFKAQARQTQQAVEGSGKSINEMAEKIFHAKTASRALHKAVFELGGAFGGAGIAAGFALMQIGERMIEAEKEADKLTETLYKAIGKETADTIEGTTSKIGSLTSAIEQAGEEIKKQGMLHSIAAFLWNDDADKAEKAFESAIDARLKLGDKLIAQEQAKLAQQIIINGLTEEQAEVFKANIKLEEELAKIEAMQGISKSQKEELADVAKGRHAEELRQIRIKKEKEADDKIAQTKHKIDDEMMKAAADVDKRWASEEQAIYKQNEDDFKKSQQEQVDAAKESDRQKKENTAKALKEMARLEKEQQETSKFGGGLLGASKAGQQALETARKQRASQTSQENYKLQDQVFSSMAKEENKKRAAQGLPPLTAQDMRVREAQKTAAMENPSIGEQAQAQIEGANAGQIAMAKVAEKQSKGGGLGEIVKKPLDWSFGGASASTQSGGTDSGGLFKTLEKVLNQLASAPLVTSAAGGAK
jgi:hypothetical protein